MSQTNLLPLNVETLRSLPGEARLAYQRTLDRRRLEDAENFHRQEMLKLSALLKHHGVRYYKTMVRRGTPYMFGSELFERHEGCDACEAITVALKNRQVFKNRMKQVERRIAGKDIRGLRKAEYVGCPLCPAKFASAKPLHYHVAKCHHGTGTCGFCNKKLRQCTAYRRFVTMMRERHARERGRRLDCQVCLRRLLSKKRLHYHIAKYHHLGARCGVCRRRWVECKAYRRYVGAKRGA
jgi:hypothetical protein